MRRNGPAISRTIFLSVIGSVGDSKRIKGDGRRDAAFLALVSSIGSLAAVGLTKQTQVNYISYIRKRQRHSRRYRATRSTNQKVASFLE